MNQPIAEVVEVLANRGVRFLGPVKGDGAVKLAFFGDPDGNTLYLAEPKAQPRRSFARYFPNVLFVSGCFAISRSAFFSSVFPGSILCHGDAPLGCGSGTTSERTPW